MIDIWIRYVRFLYTSYTVCVKDNLLNAKHQCFEGQGDTNIVTFITIYGTNVLVICSFLVLININLHLAVWKISMW